jgi:hypothetical protein
MGNLLIILIGWEQNMPQDRLIQAIGRMERALSRLEATDLQAVISNVDEPSDLAQRHEHLKAQAKAAISEIDRLLSGMEF